jgi:hypothetical protein
MTQHRTWIGCLSLAVGMIWVGIADAKAQETSVQRRIAARVPLQEIPPAIRDQVHEMLEHPTVFGRGPAEAFAGQAELYEWLLDHPDKGVQAWRRLGARCTEITDQGEGKFAWTDGHGSEIRWHTIYQNAALRVWLAEGKVRPGLLLPAVPVQMIVVLRHGKRPDGPDRTLIYHQASIFLLTDSKTATLATRLLGPSAPRIAEQCLGQMETFFSALVWYLGQHPERTEKLLGSVRSP